MNPVQQLFNSPEFADLPTGDLTVRDATLLRLWLGGESEAGQLHDTLVWWSCERDPGQELVDFLISRQVLLRSAGVALEQIAAGVPVGGGVSFFTAHGRDLLDSSLGEFVRNHAAPKTPVSNAGTARRSRLGRRSSSTSHGPPSSRRAKPSSVPDPGGDIRLPSIGSQLGRCMLIEPIAEARGGFTYRALHRTLDACVLIQLLPEAVFHRDPTLSSAFAEHARRLVEHNHPHVQRVWEFDTCDGFTYLVLEQIEGLSLRELTLNSGRIQPDKALKYLTQAVEGLESAALVDITHSDLGADSLMLTREGVLKVADFGLAPFRKLMFVCEGACGTDGVTLRSGLAGPGADIHSLGVAFHQALTGITAANPGPSHQVPPGIDGHFAELLKNMLSLDTAEGYPNYRELRLALGELEADLLARTEYVRTQTKPRGPVSAQREAWQSLLHRYGSAK